MKHDRDRFQLATEAHGAGRRRVWLITCGACRETDRVVDNSTTALPTEVISKKFSSRGWGVGVNAKRDRCPACLRTKTPKPPPMETPMKADPPKTPTPADRIRLVEEIETRWNRDKACYAKSWSDQSVAETLNVPRAWVSEVRAFAFGPDDRNEARETMIEEATELRAQLTVAQADLLKAMETVDAVDKRLKRVETNLAYTKAA